MRVVVADERSRIARELHDVVAHSVSVMLVQAGAARRILDRKPQRAADALRSVESRGHAALTELRRLLGVLTDEAGEAVLAPQPGLGQLDALAERLISAGLPLGVRIEGSPRSLPPGLDLTAYRIVQEALTNVLKHPRGAHTEVVVKYDERELGLEVVNAGGIHDPAPAVDGRGLLGMKERVAVFGGSLEAGRRPEGGFAVRARLPLEAEAGDGEEAIRAVRRLRPDVVLMDVRMPGTDGLEATRRILGDGATCRVIMLDHVRPGRVRVRRAGGLARADSCSRMCHPST